MRYAREEEGGDGGEEEAAPREARGGEEGERAEARHEALENFAEKQVREVAPVAELRRVRLRRCGLQEKLRRFHGGGGDGFGATRLIRLDDWWSGGGVGYQSHQTNC